MTHKLFIEERPFWTLKNIIYLIIMFCTSWWCIYIFWVIGIKLRCGLKSSIGKVLYEVDPTFVTIAKDRGVMPEPESPKLKLTFEQECKLKEDSFRNQLPAIIARYNSVKTKQQMLGSLYRPNESSIWDGVYDCPKCRIGLNRVGLYKKDGYRYSILKCKCGYEYAIKTIGNTDLWCDY